MKSRRDFIIKTVIIAILMTMMLAVMGFFLVRQANDSVFNSVRVTGEASLGTSSSRMCTEMDERLALADSLAEGETTEVPSEFRYDAIFVPAVESETAHLVINGKPYYLDAKQEKKFTDYPVRFVRFEDILRSTHDTPFAGETKEDYYMTFTSGEKEDGTRVVLFEHVAKFVQTDVYTDLLFDFFAIFQGNDIVMSSQQQVIAPGNHFVAPDGKDFTRGTKPSSVKGEIGGKTYLISSVWLDDYSVADGTELYYVGFTDFTAAQVTIDKYMRDSEIIVAFCIVGVVLLCTTYGVLVLRSRKQPLGTFRSAASSSDSYVVSVDPVGSIVRSNDDYQHTFSARSLADCMIGGSFGTYNEGESFMVAMTDHRLTRRVINYTVTSRKKKKGEVVEYTCGVGRDGRQFDDGGTLRRQDERRSGFDAD